MKYKFLETIKQSMALFVAKEKKNRRKNEKKEKKRERKGKDRGKRHSHSLQHDFLRFSQLYISRMKDKRSASTLQNYATAIRSFTTFLKTQKEKRDESSISLNIYHIDRYLIQEYDRWLMGRGVSINTRSCYLRSLRAIYHEYPLVRTKKINPFQDVFTGNAPTLKRAISDKEVKMIEEADILCNRENDTEKTCKMLANTQDIFRLRGDCPWMDNHS